MEKIHFDIIAHSLGVDKSMNCLPSSYYRNRYVSSGDENLDQMHKIGLLTKSDPVPTFGNDRIWTVTPEGIKQFEKHFLTLPQDKK